MSNCREKCLNLWVITREWVLLKDKWAIVQPHHWKNFLMRWRWWELCTRTMCLHVWNNSPTGINVAPLIMEYIIMTTSIKFYFLSLIIIRREKQSNPQSTAINTLTITPQSRSRFQRQVDKLLSDCCLMINKQFFSSILAKNKLHLIRW
jgi:hypothetical protein